MKTKKVGKIVSLLVAIVLVATIMIPAASVLADTGSNAVTSGIDWDGEGITVIDGKTETKDADAAYKQLNEVLRNAKAGATLHIRLDADVDLPAFESYDTNGKSTSDGSRYALATYGIFKDAYKKKNAAKPGEQSWNGTNGNQECKPNQSDFFKTENFSKPFFGETPSMVNNPLKSVLKYAAYGDTSRAFFNKNISGDNAANTSYFDLYEELDTAEKQHLVGLDNKIGYSGGIDTTKLQEYDDSILLIKKGVTVVINLNGHKVSGKRGFDSGNPFTGTPSYQYSIFNVKGDLTVCDESSSTHVANAVGMITGGTGSIYGNKAQRNNGAENYTIVNSSSSQSTAYFYVDRDNKWTQIAVKESGSAIEGNEEAGKWGTISWSHSAGNYRLYSYYYTKYYTGVKEAHGGGVYVDDSATFTLLSGKISENGAWRGGAAIFDASAAPIACGGGVYVAENATFNMLGGEVSHNAARSYQKNANLEPYAMGGGVYLAAGSTMNFKGGKVADNGTYAESNKATDQTSQGGGIYVAGGATLNMMGNLSRSDETKNIETLLPKFPQVIGNGAGVYVRTEGRTGYAEGAGVYVAANGTFNVKNAVISANDFCEFSRYADSGSGFDNTSVPAGWLITSVDRDPNTGLAVYGTGTTDKGELKTKQLLHETSGKFGVGMAYTGGSKLYTNGAGVCLASSGNSVAPDGKIVIGSRTWIYDNWDLVTDNHKAFGRTRYNKGTWDVDKQAYVYSTDNKFDKNKMTNREADPNGNHKYSVGDGYCWSDTRDDIYLPDGVTLSVGESLFECKVGINYYDMIGNGAASKSESELGKESNRVFATSSDTLDYDVWGTTSASPRPRDIQYFYLNDNNKTYEYNAYNWLPDSTKTRVTRVSYSKPPLVGDQYDTASDYKVWATRSKDGPQAPVVKEDSGDYIVGKTPFEGYVNYGVNKEQEMYDAGTPYYTYKAVIVGKKEYDYQEYYAGAKIDAGDGCPRYPDFKHLYEVVGTSYLNPVYPQVAKELPDGTNANIGENVARYMDYKVIWDSDAENGFATTSEKPVLRFGKNTDRKMYVTVDFAESNKSYFGLGGSGLNLNDSALKANVDSFSSDRTDYATVNQMTFDTVSGFKAKLTLGIPVPDYKLYKAQNLSGFTPEKADTLSRDSANNEDEDLYFKNWSFYTSYGYGPELYVPTSVKGKSADEVSNMTAYKTVNGTEKFMRTRGVFDIDLAKINNTNLNAQPCPSLTAMWYTKEELAEARRRISGVKSQRAILDDGTVVLRAIAVVGKEYADYERAGFVVSTENPTPTVEGSYDYSIKGKIYKRILVNNEKGKSWVYAYNVASDLSFENGQDGKCGIVYTNFKIADSVNNLTPEAKKQIYFVTPYVYDEDTNTYYYGKSRAISYAYLEQMDAQAGN